MFKCTKDMFWFTESDKKITNMKKDQALKRLTSLENEAKELRNIIESSNIQNDITDSIKTFTHACNATGNNAQELSEYWALCGQPKDEIAYKKLKIIASALNEGWKPNWNDNNEYKYYPYFDMRSSFGFSYTHHVGWGTGTSIGSRLCFKTAELAQYAGKQFENTYKDYLTL